jgi:hypothetical protein
MSPPPLATLPTCSAAIVTTTGPGVVIEGMGPAQGARLCIAQNTTDSMPPTGALLPPEDGSGTLTLSGYTTLGPAVRLQLAQPLGPRGLDLTLPISNFPSSAGLDSPAEQARLVVLSQFGHGAVHVTPVENITVGAPPATTELRFHLPGYEISPLSPTGTLGDVAVFEVAMPSNLGSMVMRHFTYRAIGGVSMGGLGSSMNFFRHSDLYDIVGVMGADPGPDLTYTQSFIRDFFFGGFCPSDGSNPQCPPPRAPLLDQGELFGTFDAMPVQTGNGIGLTLGRSLYLKANRDLVRALGNWAYYNPADPYLPPGVAASTLAQPPATACQNPTVFPGKMHDPNAQPFYDGRYNPDGLYDVISVCDGGQVAGQPGVFDETQPQIDPAQILFAVDLNGNGQRDKGEPIILQQSEPFQDVGTDGVADKDEPGYDPITNPDPAGDDYHYLKNPGGTEGNFRYDVGEPYQDVGIDGVAGGCDISTGQPGCFDHGEGNKQFDLNPGLQTWLAHDPHSLAEQLDTNVLQQRDIYYDAGIRDFFNAEVSTNTLFGVLAARGLPMQVYAGFPALAGMSPSTEGTYDASTAPFSSLGSAVYVRYGDPEVSAADAAQSGDGRHAGSVPEVVDRAVTLFYYILSRWPGLDTSLQSADDPRLLPTGTTFTMSNGRVTPYSIILPPGYFDPSNQNLSYPIIYIGHGYGMAPEDLGTSIGSLIQSFMASTDSTHRMPKAVLVFIDAECRPGGDVSSAPLPTSGDLCETGAFYAEHPTGDYLGETMLSELDTYLRTQYRLLPPADVMVPF